MSVYILIGVRGAVGLGKTGPGKEVEDGKWQRGKVEEEGGVGRALFSKHHKKVA